MASINELMANMSAYCANGNIGHGHHMYGIWHHILKIRHVQNVMPTAAQLSMSECSAMIPMFQDNKSGHRGRSGQRAKPWIVKFSTSVEGSTVHLVPVLFCLRRQHKVGKER